MTGNANNRPTIRRSFWLWMIAYSILLIAICLPLYFAASSFLGDWYARDNGEDAYEGAENVMRIQVPQPPVTYIDVSE